MTTVRPELCSYCARAPGTTRDHVIARQFFPPEEKYRGDLPQVPCCARCNTAKSRIEDVAGTILQFGHDSDASRKVLNDRVPRTLAKNARLARALQHGMKRVWMRSPGGVLVPRVAIEIGRKQLRSLHRWYVLVTRGLYRFETGQILQPDHRIQLIKPRSQPEYDFFLHTIIRYPAHHRRAIARGEFGYLFVVSGRDALTLWAFHFKSVEVFAITTGPDAPPDLAPGGDGWVWDE